MSFYVLRAPSFAIFVGILLSFELARLLSIRLFKVTLEPGLIDLESKLVFSRSDILIVIGSYLSTTVFCSGAILRISFGKSDSFFFSSWLSYICFLIDFPSLPISLFLLTEAWSLLFN